MDACHILLERPWQYNVDVTHRGKKNIYKFDWKDKKVVMRPITPTPESIKEKESKFASKCNRGKFFVKLKETKQGVALLVKNEVAPPAEVSEKAELL